ncbi:MAG TPA: discoidin domain-containing protein, partial [Candidatus Tumulicola sp.]|nr:discoidin domain-containing protein [Candidatus Tumulicola sp.]
SAIINGDRTGAGFGSGGIWEDANAYTFPDWVQIDFAGTKTLDHVIVYSMQDSYGQPVEPTDTMTFHSYGVIDFMVQGWDGSQWVTLGTVTGNDLVKRTVTFPAFTTDRIRVVITNAENGYSRLAEVEAFGH